MARLLVALATVFVSCVCSQSASAQVPWQKDARNPVIPASAGEGYALNPSILADAVGGSYQMWFQSRTYDGEWSLSAAISDDGVAWFAYVQNPVLEAGPAGFERDGVASCDVVRVGSEYRMYYTGIEGCCRSSIGLATSSDGLHWSRYAGNPVLQPSATGWDGEVVSGPRVYFDGVHWFMYYRGNGGGFVQTGLAISDDGLTWTKNPLNPVLPHGGQGEWDEVGAEPGGVFLDHGVMHMFYNGAPPGGPESIGLATSPDGVHWNKLGASPVLTGGGPGSWDGNVAAASVIVEQGRARLWYSGNEIGAPGWSIGLATTTLPSIISPSPTSTMVLHAHPNPFATDTEIRYAVATPGPVSMRVYDLQGREVAVLADGERAPGVYREHWNASRVDAGVYFCDLRTAGASHITKLLIVR